MSSKENPRILLIDDDLKIYRLIVSYLEPLGYEVVAEHNGSNGLRRA